MASRRMSADDSEKNKCDEKNSDTFYIESEQERRNTNFIKSVVLPPHGHLKKRTEHCFRNLPGLPAPEDLHCNAKQSSSLKSEKYLNEKRGKKTERLRENMSVHHTKKKKHKEKGKHEHRSLNKEKQLSKHRDRPKEKSGEKSHKHKEHNSFTKKLSSLSFVSPEKGDSFYKSKNKSSLNKSASIKNINIPIQHPNTPSENIVNENELKTIKSSNEVLQLSNHVTEQSNPFPGKLLDSVNTEEKDLISHLHDDNSSVSAISDESCSKRKIDALQCNGDNHSNINELPCPKRFKVDSTLIDSHIKLEGESLNNSVALSLETNVLSNKDCGTNSVLDENHTDRTQTINESVDTASCKNEESSFEVKKESEKQNTSVSLSVPETQNILNNVTHCDTHKHFEIEKTEVSNSEIKSDSPEKTILNQCSDIYDDESVSSNCCTLNTNSTSSKKETCLDLPFLPVKPERTSSSSGFVNNESSDLKIEHSSKSSYIHKKKENESSKNFKLSGTSPHTIKSNKHSSQSKTSNSPAGDKIKDHSHKHQTKLKNNSCDKDKTKKSKHNRPDYIKIKSEVKSNSDSEKKLKVLKDENSVAKNSHLSNLEPKNLEVSKPKSSNDKDKGHKQAHKSNSNVLVKTDLCIRCRQRLTTHRNVSIQCKRDRHDKLCEKIGVSQKIPRLPQGLDMKHLKYGKYIRLEVYPNGGAALLHLYWDEISHLHRKELKCLAEEFLRCSHKYHFDVAIHRRFDVELSFIPIGKGKKGYSCNITVGKIDLLVTSVIQ
ncbi:round spermatid basic protein 1-like protein [Trichonephila inaurata madagascariensis]|uniref:Round spermatid basic protein 1-like protein n=1 Tax=Trichonephila inaurata madagascariensis TaxID=2747483 RepID=A0A8X6XK81_9ARAC|nr:round spermatid basic protein 1-like protein [Trichonephila inaurata madagascariensis]